MKSQRSPADVNNLGGGGVPVERTLIQEARRRLAGTIPQVNPVERRVIGGLRRAQGPHPPRLDYLRPCSRWRVLASTGRSRRRLSVCLSKTGEGGGGLLPPLHIKRVMAGSPTAIRWV